ncbi:AAA family ATPase [Variovorax sp. LT1P1]|uniref:AAA family ATPase n=1 Tax=Variovorax sp. LT1P1 TaxID=3443730 RepID=UPI003F453500
MRIERLNSLRNYRVFKDFTWPAGLMPFGQFSLIYGWNGSGKTSISSLLRNCQDGVAPEGDVELLVDGKVVKGSDFPGAALPPIRVFNRDFVDRTVFEDPNRQLPPVYVVSDDGKAKQTQLEALRQELKDIAAAYSEAKNAEGKQRGASDKFCTDRARTIRALLIGDPSYSNYEAPRFRTRVKLMALAAETPVALTQEQRGAYESTMHSTFMTPIGKLDFPSFDLTDFTSRVLDKVQQNVVAHALASLVDNTELASWVQHGLIIHGDDATTCHFCESPMPHGRIASLRGHFNDRVQKLQHELMTLRSEALKFVEALRQLMASIPVAELLYPHLRGQYKLHVEQAEAFGTLMASYLRRLLRLIRAKLNTPFAAVDIQSNEFHSQQDDEGDEVWSNCLLEAHMATAYTNVAALFEISKHIAEHNRLSANFQAEASAARAALEADEVLKALPDWRQLENAIDEAETTSVTKGALLDKLKNDVSALAASIKDHRPTAAQLTAQMTEYLGRKELTFEYKDTGYLIRRNGEPALHLSEGERTAIAFVYFLNSLTDESFEREKGVVVIDDPVSSLDQNSLYCAFGYMQEHTVGVEQLVVLTHNFSFFRLVKNWFNHEGGSKALRNKVYVPEESKFAQFYMLRSKGEGVDRTSRLTALDPLLHKHESEYHYLFSKVVEASRIEGEANLEEMYGMPNIARRLVEAFLAFRVPGGGELRQTVRKLKGDVATHARIVRFLNAHSHKDRMDDSEGDASLLSETPAIMRAVLGYIELNDKEHYDKMVELMPIADQPVVAMPQG